jgi:hypothetical protein
MCFGDSRNRIMDLDMSQSRTCRREPRGRPAIGFVLEAPREVELRDGAIVRCCETRPDGKRVGELEISVFAAPLIIDRDGLLAEKASEALTGLGRFRDGVPSVAVRLPGAEGFRAAAVQGEQLPYLHAFAVTADEIGDGGLLVTIRAAGPDWPAADHILRSLRILTRQGRVATCTDADEGPLLPVVSPRRS